MASDGRGAGAGGGVARRARGGGVAIRERASSGVAAPVGLRGGGAGGGATGTVGMPGMLGRITPGIGMFAAGTPISVRPIG